jgi:hypothetical protein
MSKKTVSIALEEEDYEALKQLAKDEDQDVSGQGRHMLRDSLAAQAHLDRVSRGLVASLDAGVPEGETKQEPLPG